MPTPDPGQLALLREQGHAAHWFFYPVVTRAIFTAQINDASIVPGATALTYDNITAGVYTDIKPGMTLWVGTSPGASNVARIRVRYGTSAQIKVAENADVAWADNLYITVKKEWVCWSIRPNIIGETVYKDGDIAFTNQTIEWPPVAMMGDPAIQFDTGAGANIYFDGSESYAVAPGASIVGYLWDFDDGTTSTSATPGNHLYPSGQYWPSLTVLDDNGQSHTAHRPVAVISRETAISLFQCQSLTGQVDGGWSARFNVFDPNADENSFPSRAPCFCFAYDVFGETVGSVGFPLGRENVVLFGYIQEDSVERVPETSAVTFVVESLAAEMDKTGPFPTFVMDSDAPTDWNNASGLNVWRSMIYLLKFHSTVMDIADVALYQDTTLSKITDFPEDSLWNMLSQFAKGKRLLRTSVTRTGRLVVGRDPNLLPVSSRSAVPVICQMLHGDWADKVLIPEKPFPQTSFLCVSGDAYDGDPTHKTTPLFGMSPGHPPKEYGRTREIQNMKLVDQSEVIAIAGLAMGQDNNPFGPLNIPMNGNWLGVLEPALQEYIQAPSDGFPNSRGATMLQNQYIIVRSIEVTYDWAAGIGRPQVTGEVYSYPEIATVGDCFDHDGPLEPLPSPIFIIPPPPPVRTGVAPHITTAASVCSGTSARASLAWTPIDHVSTHYLERSINPASGYAVIFTDTTDAEAYIDTAVTAGVVYYYRVRAFVSGHFTAYSNLGTVTINLCAPVLTATACDMGVGEITLSWTSVTGAAGYKVERSPTGSGDWMQIALLGPGLYFLDTDVEPDAHWFYRVRAYRATGNGAYSNVADAVGCLTPVPFHNRAVLFTASHVYEWDGFGGYGYPSVPNDVTGTLPLPISAGHAYADGTLTVIASNRFFRRAPSGGSSWNESVTPAVLAKNASLWSREYFPAEDGTGPHGTAYYNTPLPNGCHPTAEGDGSVHWGYISASTYMQIIGGVVSFYNSLVSISADCSMQHNGLWHAPAVDGLLSSPAAGFDGTPPDVWDQGMAIIWGAGTPAHFSPYDAEGYHNFIDEFAIFTAHYFDGLPFTPDTGSSPVHVTDDGGNIWYWGFDSIINVNRGAGFVPALDEATMEAVSGRPDIDIRLAGGVQSINVCPASMTRRAIVFIRPSSEFIAKIFKTVDDCTTWTMNDAPDTAEQIYTVASEEDQLYVVDLNGGVWTSPDDGAHWYHNFVGPGEAALGFWVDPLS